MYFARLLADRLAEAGIPVGAVAQPAMEESLPDGRAIFAVENTLPLVLQRCNKDSQNLFAECLLKRMGRAITGAPGSWDNGAAAVRRFLSDELQTQSASISIADGSGMSRDNRITAGVMVSLLAAMRGDAKVWPIYRDSLSIKDIEGDLKRRFESLAPKLAGKLYPKTGGLHEVITLSGYLVVPDGGGERTFAFSLLFNGKAPPGRIFALQNQILMLLDKQATPPPAANASPRQ
jgi:D-alanyl-D-alanine carboxypeptidase/D-alanyl-D-alanine-endopeptidase (penicillin-binding protein 4)